MRSAAAAIGWQFHQRHRWVLVPLAGYLLLLAALKRLGVSFGDEEAFAFVVIVPMTVTYIYFLAVFSFGLDGDLAARHSIYPARMFALPITNGALAGWPMIYGTVAAAVLWLAMRVVAVWPKGVTVPVIWPALLAASLLAWTQALTWMPYALPGLRVVVTILWLALIDTIAMVALQLRVPEPVMLAILAPHIPFAYITARFAVGRARRGEVPDWRAMFGRPARTADILLRGDDFSSATRAQTWFEWRLHGMWLPALVGILLPFEMAMLFLFRETPAIVFETLACALLTPPFMAAFAAAEISRPNPSFIATRPLTTASLVAAKLKVMIASTLTAWLLVAVTVPLALKLSGTLPLVIEKTHRICEIFGNGRASAIGIVVLALLVTATWKQLVQSLLLGMSGREWLVKAAALGALIVLVIIGPVAEWISRNKAAIALLWNAFPWVAAALVGLKLAAAGWVMVRLRDSSLLRDRTLLVGAACWDVLVFALYGLLVWIVPAVLVQPFVFALVAILEVPLLRPSAALLAVAWNRHR